MEVLFLCVYLKSVSMKEFVAKESVKRKSVNHSPRTSAVKEEPFVDTRITKYPRLICAAFPQKNSVERVLTR